ncbi:uncharacterized protein LOC113234862 [Hyposmocoma kahamanoa]|uniref:uncharacterized protein LOC113234862 n=1 Tax=Hyposmocoma kahamanoa TaxID=1477025 RepID=UPI000E6D6588|nr:uncharacterized protein LOC113234862 [Hyposmocoma kahamanoa]
MLKDVFCLQTSALIPIGDIFLIGDTIALAWMLPTDPEFLLKFKDHKALKASRRNGEEEIVFINQDGKIVGKVPYKRKKFINPTFAKRSIDEKTFKEKLVIKIDRIKMHEKQLNREYLKRDHMNERSIEFHRKSRLGLYEKLETFLTALGRDGRQCILRKLCESARSGRQGTFLQELLRVIFTLPKGREFKNEDHKAYDKAHNADGDCTTLYPGCNDVEQQF